MYHMEVRYANVEALIHVGVPDHPHIGDVDSTKVTLHKEIGCTVT